MTNIKKIAALVIVLAMALSSVALAAFPDVSADSSNAEAIEVLSKLGIILGYEDGTFGPDKTITRAEFTTLVVKAMGMGDTAAGAASTKFADVPSTHWASGFVAAGVQNGFINGYDETTFGPEDEVTYEQAVKMLVCAIGYTPKFQITKTLANGTTVRELDPSAYPTAYLAEANTAGITTGAAGKTGDKATRGLVAKLVYNTLTTAMMEQTKFGTDPEWSVPTTGYKTLLVDYLGYDKIEATIASVSFDPTTKDKVTITPTKIIEADEKDNYTIGRDKSCLYDAAKMSPTDYKGYSCVMFLDNQADDDTVVAIYPKTGRNVTLTLTSDQFCTSVASDTADKLLYYKNDNNDSTNLTAKLDSSFTVYENKNTSAVGRAAFITEYNKADTDANNSKYVAVELIDNDNDGDYDIAFATVYVSMVVGTINTRTYKITQDSEADGAKGSITLDPDSDKVKFEIVDADGNALTFEDIKEGDILNIFESDDNGSIFYKVMVTNNTVTGTVTSKDSSSEKYTIAGTKYESLTAIEVGDYGTFSIDAYGKVIMCKLEESSRTFGYVYNADVDKNNFEEEAALVIYDTQGKFVTYYFAKNPKIDGTTKAKDDLLQGATNSKTLIAEVAALKNQIVCYETNSSGEITALYSQDSANGIKKLSNNRYSVKNTTADAQAYKASTNAIAGGFIAEDTAMWTCKNKYADRASSAKTDYSIAYSTSFADSETYNIVAIVDSNNNNNIVAAVVYDMTAMADPESSVVFVTSVGSGKTEDGDTATTVTGIKDGEEVSFMITSDTDIVKPDKKAYTDAIAKGDVLQYTGADIASGVTVIITAKDLAKPADIKSSAYADEGEKKSDFLGMTNANGWLYACQVEKYKSNVVTWADATENTLRVAATTPAMLYRPTSAKVYASADDISADLVETNDDYAEASNDDYLVVYQYDGTVLAAIIVDVDGDTEF